MGTGASAAQVIQELAPQVQQLTVYQRSPMVGFPKAKDPDEREWTDREHAKKVTRECSLYHSAFPFVFRSDRTMEVPEKDRHALYAKLIEEGNWSLLLATFEDSVYNLEANSEMYRFWAKKMRERVNDPRLKDLLIPLEPSYPIGMKRPCLESGYYEVFNQQNVELVDVSATPVEEVTETGILTNNTHRPFDYIIWATGFQARTSTLTHMNIQGKNGLTFESTWNQGVCTHLGMATHGFPNLFYLYGPQSATLRVNAPAVIKAQVEWLSRALIDMKESGITSCEPTREAETIWWNKTADPWYRTLYPRAQSWETRGADGKRDEPSW